MTTGMSELAVELGRLFLEGMKAILDEDEKAAGSDRLPAQARPTADHETPDRDARAVILTLTA